MILIREIRKEIKDLQEGELYGIDLDELFAMLRTLEKIVDGK